jgi:hypothetical protein
MAYIGNTTTSIPFIADSFSGNASTTSFSPLSRAPAGTASIAVFIAGVYQPPSTYSLVGTAITFGSAPASGVGNITVLHLGNGSTTQVPSDGSVTLLKISGDTYGYINTAFIAANTPSYTANSGASYANSAFLVANTPTHVANSAASYANSSFTTANTAANNTIIASSYANSAFLVANTPTHVANSAALYANGAFTKANSVVTSIVAGSGISVSSSTGAVTVASTGGTVTSITAGNGLSTSGGAPGGTITSSGTLYLAAPSYGSVGSYVYGIFIVQMSGSLSWAVGATYPAATGFAHQTVAGTTLTGGGCGTSEVATYNLTGTWSLTTAGSTAGSGQWRVLMVRTI